MLKNKLTGYADGSTLMAVVFTESLTVTMTRLVSSVTFGG